MSNATIVLKTIHNAIVTDNPDSTLTTKQMRAKLRVARRDAHVKNTSWVFTPDEADDIRAMFDEPFAAKLERRRKRTAKSNAPKRNNRSRSRKSNASTDDATTETSTTE